MKRKAFLWVVEIRARGSKTWEPTLTVDHQQSPMIYEAAKKAGRYLTAEYRVKKYVRGSK